MNAWMISLGLFSIAVAAVALQKFALFESKVKIWFSCWLAGWLAFTSVRFSRTKLMKNGKSCGRANLIERRTVVLVLYWNEKKRESGKEQCCLCLCLAPGFRRMLTLKAWVSSIGVFSFTFSLILPFFLSIKIHWGAYHKHTHTHTHTGTTGGVRRSSSIAMPPKKKMM